MKYFTQEELSILNGSYGTATALLNVLLNIYSQESFKEVELGKVIFCSDEKHRELFYKILEVPLEYINGRQIQLDIEYFKRVSDY